MLRRRLSFFIGKSIRERAFKLWKLQSLMKQ